jgi:predicted ATPase/DNA-binding CsgD family transcriptional regulator
MRPEHGWDDGVQTAPKLQRPSGLPAEVSFLVGRGPQIAAVLERLHTARVVTLTGPGGCGKTRLALRAAALAEEGFNDGARLAELAPLTDPALVPATVAEVLQVPERDATSPAAALVRILADREVLVVLDNCEHVLQATASLAVTLLERCPRVRILATSRERLDLPGEFVFPVPPLGLPQEGSAEAVAASEAGLLFTARARAANPAFEVTAHNSAAIAELCSRLEGMPLAIELAAARCPALSPEDLTARLDGHPGLLSGGPARPGRHRSLEALVAWSYELLDDDERRLLARLSVLRGGFELDTAERVAAGGPLPVQVIAGLLASLVGKSVVQAHAAATVRYSLLETIRQFAAARLAESGEETAAHLRLLRWALDVAASAEAALASADWPAQASRLSVEQASIRAALSWALGGPEPEAGRELAARLARWWIATGRYSEGGQFLGTALSIGAAATHVQARILLGAAWSAYNLGDAPQAARLAGEGLGCAQQAGEPQLEAWGRNLLAGLAWYAGDAGRVRALLEPSTGRLDKADRALAARAHVLLANAAHLAGDLAEYQRHGQRAVELARAAAGHEGLALALTVAAAAAICGAGISPSTQAMLNEAATLVKAQADRFTETILRHWRARLFATVGQLDAAQTEVQLCRAAGRDGAVRAAEIIAPFAEARLTIATGDTAGAADALHRAADAGRQASIAMFVPALLASQACLAAIAGDDPAAAAAVAETRAALSGRHEAITQATLCYAEGIMAWHRGELADAERLIRTATLQWHRCSDRMAASDGVELLGALAAARERYGDAARLLAAADAARPRLGYLTPGFTADRRAAARAASHARHVLGEDSFAQAWEQGQGLTLDDAVTHVARKGGGRKRPATGWASLTPTELQVARLAAEGLRNDAIARRLFIAPGTVKVHLSHIFTKLGITTRAELAAQAASRT